MRNYVLGLLALLLLAMAGGVTWFLSGNRGADDPASASPMSAAEATALRDPALIARGAYLATLGDCASCHTAQGGTRYAGGRLLATPFGGVASSNLTPDFATGLGAWNAEDFWQALHRGRGRHGERLYPVFPYTSYTRITRDDAMALFAYLRTLSPVSQPARKNELRFPYNQRNSLLLWQALYFKPSEYRDDAAQSAIWNRGAYLVQGLGHCNECHAPRDGMGAMTDPSPLSGGLMAAQGWYAPDLSQRANGALQGWHEQDVKALLQTGYADKGTAFGPMAEVVEQSTQHLNQRDLQAVATYLATLPARAPTPSVDHSIDITGMLSNGLAIYATRCAGCHGDDGNGIAGVYPALNDNPSVTEPSGINATRIVLLGGFGPLTAARARPYSMPSFATSLSDAAVAAVVTYIRQAWDNKAGLVQERDVNKSRNAAAD